MMKKFFIFIFTMFGLMVGLMVGWVVFMGYSYQRSYNEWKNSYSGSKVTFPAQKYSSSSSSTEYDYK